jgi:hypothetical protein
MEILAECAKNRVWFISRLLLSDTEKTVEFVKISYLLAEIPTLDFLITEQKVKIFTGFSWF